MRGKSKDLKKIMLYLHCTKNKPGLDRKIVWIQLFTYRCLFWRVSYWLVKFKFCWNKWTFTHLIFNYEVDVLFRRNFLDWKIEPIFKSTKQPKTDRLLGRSLKQKQTYAVRSMHATFQSTRTFLNHTLLSPNKEVIRLNTYANTSYFLCDP